MKDKEQVLELLDSLDAINESSAINFYVPSLGKDVKFKPITIHHQQQFNLTEDSIFRTGADQLSYIEFCKTYDDVLKDTCIDDSIDVDTLLTIDRIALSIQHRVEIDKMMDIVTYIDEEETFTSIDLSKMVGIAKKTVPKKLVKKFKHQSITITTGFPTLKHDREINNVVEKILDLENQAVINSEDVEAVIEDNFSELLLALLGKYITEISVNDKIISIDRGSTADTLICAIQKLPLSLLSKVNEAQDEYKAREAAIVTSKYKIDGENTDIVIDLGAGLFTGI
jgi:hypothetical protein